jgi:hypothetical protein
MLLSGLAGAWLASVLAEVLFVPGEHAVAAMRPPARVMARAIRRRLVSMV